MAKPAHVIGPVCHIWDHKAGKCKEEIDVLQVAGTKSAHFISKLAVDADGAPKAYHPADKKKPDNSGGAFDWLGNLKPSDLHGIQGQDGAVGPAPGFFISGTSLHNDNFPMNDTRHWVDARTVPYAVLPGSNFPVPEGTKLKKGCVLFVVDTKTGKWTGAIYADVGHAVGEGSIALALRLGLDPFRKDFYPKVKGFDGKRFFYLVFPTIVVPAPWAVDTIQNKSEAQFKKGEGPISLRPCFQRFRIWYLQSYNPIVCPLV